jgi:hypothetical protein
MIAFSPTPNPSNNTFRLVPLDEYLSEDYAQTYGQPLATGKWRFFNNHGSGSHVTLQSRTKVWLKRGSSGQNGARAEIRRRAIVKTTEYWSVWKSLGNVYDPGEFESGDRESFSEIFFVIPENQEWGQVEESVGGGTAAGHVFKTTFHNEFFMPSSALNNPFGVPNLDAPSPSTNEYDDPENQAWSHTAESQKELVHLKMNSLDRYFQLKLSAQEVQMLGGPEKVKISLEIPQSFGEIAGDFSGREYYEVALNTPDLFTAPPSGSDEGIFFPSEDIAQDRFARYTAPVAVSFDGVNYRIVTCFKQIGNITVKVVADSQTKFQSSYKLTPHAAMEELIVRLNRILRESAYYQGLGGVNIASLAKTSLMHGPFNDAPVQVGLWDDLMQSPVAQCCSAVFEKIEDHVVEGIVAAKEFIEETYKNVIDGVIIAVVGAQGYATGMWAGVKAEAEGIADFAKMLAHPIETGKSMYEAFRKLCDMSMEQLKKIPKHMIDEFMSNAQKQIAWAEPTGTDLLAYTIGYTSGFVVCQVIVTVVKVVLPGGIAVAGANIGMKVAGILSKAKAGQKILEGLTAVTTVAAKVQKAKTLAMKTCSQFIKKKTGLDRLEHLMIKTLKGGCP